MSAPQRSGATPADAAESLDALLSHLAHEARTPLSVVHGYGELLARAGGEGVVGDAARAIPRSTRRLSTALDELVAAFALESGLLVLDLQPLSLGELLADAVAAEHAACDDHRFVVSSGASGLWALADAEHALLAVKLVLRASCKRDREGGEVRLDVARRERQVEVVVGARGGDRPARTAGYLARDGETRALELDVARRLVELQGGRLRDSLNASGGRRLSFSLPLVAVR